MRFKKARTGGALALAAVVAAAVMWPSGPVGAVVGGVSAPGYYPYFVRVKVHFADGYSSCGGSLIAPSWVLSGAHCFAHDTPYEYTEVTIGSGRGTATGASAHPLYNGDTHDGHDLALIQVPPNWTVGVPPIQVGAPSDPGAYAAGTLATIMGTGMTSWNSDPSENLLAVDTVLRSDEYMNDMWDKWYTFDNWPDRLAIGAGARGETACKGDSGGPLVVYRNEVHVQVGVGSFTKDGCKTAAGFAELAGPQLAWVASHVPSIMERWGPCQLDLYRVGQYTARYTTTPFDGAQRDGAYYWTIGCEPADRVIG
jgi:hypothetical protein